MKSTAQRDLLIESDAEMAKRYRTAADIARIDPHWTRAEQEYRHAHYSRIAEALEAAGCEVQVA